MTANEPLTLKVRRSAARRQGVRRPLQTRAKAMQRSSSNESIVCAGIQELRARGAGKHQAPLSTFQEPRQWDEMEPWIREGFITAAKDELILWHQGHTFHFQLCLTTL